MESARCIEMPQCSSCTKATALAQRWLFTHAVCLWEVDTDTHRAFVLLGKKKKRGLWSQKLRSRRATPLWRASWERRASWRRLGERLRAKPSVLLEGGDVPMGITIPLWFLAGDRHVVTAQMFAGKRLQEKQRFPLPSLSLVPLLPRDF